MENPCALLLSFRNLRLLPLEKQTALFQIRPTIMPLVKLVKSCDLVLMTHSDANPPWNMIDVRTCFFLY